MKFLRPTVLISVFAVALVIAGALGVLFLPRVIDSQTVKNRISVELSKQLSARLAIGKIEPLWFPQPTVVIDNAELAFDNGNRVSIGSVRIYPSMMHLFTGRFVVRRALLQKPKITIQLPESSTLPTDREILESQIRSALLHFTGELPASSIELVNGSAEIRATAKSPVIVDELTAEVAASAAALSFDLSGRSSLCERLKIEGRIVPENLASQLDIIVEGLKIGDALAFVPASLLESAGQGEANLQMKIASVGLRQIKATIGGSSGPMVFAQRGGSETLQITKLNGTVTYESGALQFDVQQLDLASPKIRASGQFRMDSNALTANIKARDVDIVELGGWALRILNGAEEVKAAMRYLRAGTIAEVTIHSAGRSLADLASSKNVAVSGLLRNGRIFLPAHQPELTEVSGSVQIANGVLDAKDITANLGPMKGRNGTLKLGLAKTTSPFHLDILVQTGAPELKSALLQVVQDDAARAQLLKLRNVEGELSGRLILGETLDAISPIVEISKTDVRAIYEPVPFPIVIREGQLSYDRGVVNLKNARGSLGRSTFQGLGVTWRHDMSRQIKIDSEKVLVDLQQTDRFLRSFKDLQSHRAKLRSMRGQIELQNLKLAGPYDDPAEWNFASTGTLDQIEIRHADFPASIMVSHGKFAAQPGRIRFFDTAAKVSNAAVVASGSFEYREGKLIQVETHGMGTLDAQMTQWLSRYIQLPEAVKLRSPLKVTTERLAWRAGGDINFKGQVTVAGNTRLSFDVVKPAEGLVVQNLTIDDSGQSARMSLQFVKDKLDFSFSGELTPETIDKIFVSFPMKGSFLGGDIQIKAVLSDATTVSAHGQLIGGNLLLPFGTEKALLEKFAIEASEDTVRIRSGNLRWRNSHLSVGGKVSGGKKALRLDLDLTVDQLGLEDVEHFFTEENTQDNKIVHEILSSTEGTIRLKLDQFAAEYFTLSNLQIKTAIAPSAIKAEIERGAICGIDTSGSVELVDQIIALNLQLSATNAQLEPTTTCLTNQRSDIKGVYSLSARIAGNGEWEQIRPSLKGDFQLNARDGEFVQSAGIDATFDYLNRSGDFAVEFPDLNKQVFPYRMLSIKGRIDGESVFNDEIIVQSSSLTVTGRGSVDLQNKEVDIKGLISLALPAQQVLRRVPIIGGIVGGGLVGIPLRVSGSWERPDVTYLSPADVGAELLNIPLRILGMPLEALRLFTPNRDLPDKNSTQ